MSVRVITWVWDHSMSEGTDRLVMLALADSADDAGSCWPSMLTLARKAKVNERTVRRSIRTLEGMGEVSTVAGGGTTSNRYRILLDPRVQSVRSDPGQPAPSDTSPPGRDAPPGQPAPGVKPDNGEQSRGGESPGADTGVRGTVKRSSKNKNKPSSERAPSSSSDPRFVEFWDTCPKKVGKADAFRMYQAAVRNSVPSSTLLEGMRRYALSVRGTDSKFIVHPATWLHGGRWDDETTGPRPGGSDTSWMHSMPGDAS